MANLVGGGGGEREAPQLRSLPLCTAFFHPRVGLFHNNCGGNLQRKGPRVNIWRRYILMYGSIPLKLSEVLSHFSLP